MRFLKIFISIFGATLVLIISVYFIAGYFTLGLAFKEFQNRGRLKEHQIQFFSSEKNLTEKEKKEVEEFKKTLSRQDLADLESVKKEFAVPRKKKPKKKKEREPVTPEDVLRMQEFNELSSFAESIVKEDPNFNPCDSICGESPLRSLQEESVEGVEEEVIAKPKTDILKRLKDYYGQSEEQALKDPGFNYVVLFLANLRTVVPKEVTDFMIEIMSKDPKAIENDHWLKAKILVKMPIWVYRMQKGMEKAEDLHEITKNFLNLHKSCKKGKLIKREAQRQCVELFDHYDFE